uniref:Uncharacterized protein n=1 Tax=Anguilla anguilla TaxID=7936 RepID=A0A0E9VPG5_ANGAN
MNQCLFYLIEMKISWLTLLTVGRRPHIIFSWQAKVQVGQ